MKRTHRTPAKIKPKITSVFVKRNTNTSTMAALDAVSSTAPTPNTTTSVVTRSSTSTSTSIKKGIAQLSPLSTESPTTTTCSD